MEAGGARACAERTLNIELMVVTLDVSQLEMSSLKEVKLLNNESMSVIAETIQLAIGPCALRAAALSLTQSWTAASRAALVAKLPNGGVGGGNTNGGGGAGGGAGGG